MTSKIMILEEEIKRKNEIIKKLREENALLMKMSVRSAEEKISLKHKIHEMSSEQ